MTRTPCIDHAFAGHPPLAPLKFGDSISDTQSGWRSAFAKTLYGTIPPPPDDIDVQVEDMAGTIAKRIVITIRHGRRRFSVDAALWSRPGDAPAPLIAGLEFTGPAGVLAGEDFPLDPMARVHIRPELDTKDGRLHDALRGTAAHRWPVNFLTQQGFAVLVSCYGSWVPDCRETWQDHGLFPFLNQDTRAISLWAWALQRLIDVGKDLAGVDATRVAIAGHSRLGKAAVWAAANDARVDAVLANNSGCGGTALAHHRVGETLTEMAERFPHWIKPGPDPRLVDQHQLIACIAPRKVYIASAAEDIWADPLGSYMALKLAAPAWTGEGEWPSPEDIWKGAKFPNHHALGHHIRPGGHDMLPYDWHQFIQFLKDTQASI